VAAGYYFIAIYLEHGAAGLAQDPEMALRYYRKAADEGNPQAQAYVGINWLRLILRLILHDRCFIVLLNRGGKRLIWGLLGNN
jgi:hypothetical protein